MAPFRGLPLQQQPLTLDTTMKSTPGSHTDKRDDENKHEPSALQEGRVSNNLTEPLHQSSSGSNSQSTPRDIITTPPSSAEDPSSQSRPTEQLPFGQAKAEEPFQRSASTSHLPAEDSFQVTPSPSDTLKGTSVAQTDRTQRSPLQTSPASKASSSSMAGQKRTSSGFVKPTEAVSSGDSSSTVKANSPAEEAKQMAALLRLRLSYARFKMDNGWEHLTFEEVERRMAQRKSRASSRRASVHDRPTRGPPRTSLTGLARDGSGLSEHDLRSSGTLGQRAAYGPRSSGLDYVATSTAAGPFSAARVGVATELPPSDRTRTYEEFWRAQGPDKDLVMVDMLIDAQRASVGTAPLAPPFSILPSSAAGGLKDEHERERWSRVAFMPPHLLNEMHEEEKVRQEVFQRQVLAAAAPHLLREIDERHKSRPHHVPIATHGSLAGDHFSTAASPSKSSATMPATPPAAPRSSRRGERRRPSVIRTPSQNAAAMEQEAVRTLVNMSSPGGHNGPGVFPRQVYSPAAPHRARTPVGGDDLDDATDDDEDDGEDMDLDEHGEDDEIDRMLDAMSDDSDDD